jgi:hypothetical protein
VRLAFFDDQSIRLYLQMAGRNKDGSFVSVDNGGFLLVAGCGIIRL